MISCSNPPSSSHHSPRRHTANRLIGGIYVIVDPQHTSDRPVIDIALAVIEGGARAVQLRDKHANRADLLRDASAIAAMCRNSDVIFIINDHPDIAAESGAHGVHVGQGDAPVSLCRKQLREEQIVGKSNALLDEARASVTEGADYVAVGTIFPTSTKQDTRPAGIETLRYVASHCDVPVVAIGGINIDNIADVAAAGADVACVATAVTMSDDPASAVFNLAETFSKAMRNRLKNHSDA